MSTRCKRPFTTLLFASLTAVALLVAAAASADDSASPEQTSVEAPAVDSAPVPIPEPSERAIRYHRSGNVLWLVTTLWSLAVPALILLTGWSAKLRARSERIGKRWYFAFVLYFVGFVLLTFAMNLPIDFYAEFMRSHEYGLSSQTPGKWLGDKAIGTLILLIAGALLLWPPFLLLRRTSRRWWLYCWIGALPVLVFVAFIQPLWIEPLFNDFVPMQDRQLEARILDQLHDAGFADVQVVQVNKSADTNELNAYVTGVGGSARIVLWDTIIRKLDERQLLFVVAHEMEHYAHQDVWRAVGLLSALLLIGLLMLDRAARWAMRRWSTRFGFTELHDIAALPLLMLLSLLIIFVMTPPVLAYSRYTERAADRFALELTRDNHACATAYVVATQNDLGYPRPGLLYKLWRAGHPPIAERIESCNNYR